VFIAKETPGIFLLSELSSCLIYTLHMDTLHYDSEQHQYQPSGYFSGHGKAEAADFSVASA